MGGRPEELLQQYGGPKKHEWRCQYLALCSKLRVRSGNQGSKGEAIRVVGAKKKCLKHQATRLSNCVRRIDIVE